jgi:hypothetical protein
LSTERVPGGVKRDLIPIEEAAKRLAPVCLAIAQQYPQAHGALKSHLKLSLKCLVRDAERYVRPKVSAGALKTAEEMGISDLRSMQWRDQPKRMNDPGRKIFHHEHVTRVADMADDILALPHPDLAQIERIIRGIVVAWILKLRIACFPLATETIPMPSTRLPKSTS